MFQYLIAIRLSLSSYKRTLNYPSDSFYEKRFTVFNPLMKFIIIFLFFDSCRGALPDEPFHPGILFRTRYKNKSVHHPTVQWSQQGKDDLYSALYSSSAHRGSKQRCRRRRLLLVAKHCSIVRKSFFFVRNKAVRLEKFYIRMGRGLYKFFFLETFLK